MSNKKSEKPMPKILPEGRPLRIRCTVTETDQFQADFLGEYGDMIYLRRSNLRNTVIAVVICIILAVVILLSKEMLNQAVWFPVVFALMYLSYGIYYYFVGYKNNYKQFQQHLERAVDKGITVYPEETILYDFQDSAVYMDYDSGDKRYFLYEDIRYFEETDRFYLFGMKYKPKENRLAGFERALLPKRDLDPDTEERLLQIMANVVEAYELKPVLDDHPFK
ncbi:MAG: DUF4179 domain-containing protein [Oscillospiraceae bacterium]|nr:DUF4179 domain-containing protein [Oscillospiraceae bacterium]